MINLSLEKRRVCEIQRRLFELAVNNGYDSAVFLETFMNSAVAAGLDETYHPLQWKDEAYLLEALIAEAGEFAQADITYSSQLMSWAGMLYRYWHYHTGESSKEIYAAVNAETLHACWSGFHNLGLDLAINYFREYNGQKAAEAAAALLDQTELTERTEQIELTKQAEQLEQREEIEQVE